MSDTGLEFKSLINNITALVLKNIASKITDIRNLSEESILAVALRYLNSQNTAEKGFRSGIKNIELSDIYSPDLLNKNMDIIKNDLFVIFGESVNIDSYITKIESYIRKTILSNQKYLSSLISRLTDYEDVLEDNIDYTDIIHKTFNSRDNTYDGEKPLTIDLYAENLKLDKESIIRYFEEGKANYRYDILSLGGNDLEVTDKEVLFNSNEINPWYISVESTTDLVNTIFFGEDYSDDLSLFIVVYIDFPGNANFNQIRYSPFTNTSIILEKVYTNNTQYADDRTPGWNEIVINNLNDMPFSFEYNIEKAQARTLALLFKMERGTKQEDEVDYYKDADIKTLVKEIYENKQPVKLHYTGYPQDNNYTAESAFDNLENYLNSVKTTRFKNNTIDYIFGFTSFEINLVKYRQVGSYISPVRKADGNILGIQIEDNSIITYNEDSIPNTMLNYSVYLGDENIPIANQDDNGYINEALILTNSDNGDYLYVTTRFAIDVAFEPVFMYNGRELESSEYDFISLTTDGKAEYKIKSDDARIYDAIGIKYKAVNTLNGKEYSTDVINVLEELGVPNVTRSELRDIVTTDYYMYSITGDVTGDEITGDETEYEPVEDTNTVIDSRYTELEHVIYDDEDYIMLDRTDISYDYSPLLPWQLFYHKKGFVPYKYYDIPIRRMYCGIIDETPTITGDHIETEYDFRRDTLIVTDQGDKITDIEQWYEDAKNKIKVNSSYKDLKVTYYPINRKINLSSNIAKHQYQEEHDFIPENRKIKLGRYPFIDIDITGNKDEFELSNGVFTYKRNIDVTYEPIQVFINRRKAIDMTSYRTTDKTNLPEPKDYTDIRFYIDGDTVYFNTSIYEAEIIIKYYTLSDNIRLAVDMFRIDNIADDRTPELYSTTLLVDVRKNL